MGNKEIKQLIDEVMEAAKKLNQKLEELNQIGGGVQMCKNAEDIFIQTYSGIRVIAKALGASDFTTKTLFNEDGFPDYVKTSFQYNDVTILQLDHIKEDKAE